MAEPRSALAGVYEQGRIGASRGVASVNLRERVGRTLVQVSGWPGEFDALSRQIEARLSCRVPGDCRTAMTDGARSIFRVAPERLWLAAPADDAGVRTLAVALRGENGAVTEIGHSRTVLCVGGAGAGLLLNRGLPVDLDAAVFPDDAFAQSVIGHVPVLVHRRGAEGGVFDAYVTRDYAVTFWQWLTCAAQALGGEVRAPE